MPKPKARGKKLEVRIDQELYDDAQAYAEENNISVGALVRALLRFWVDRRDPRPLPPGIAEEMAKSEYKNRKKRSVDED